MSAVTVLVFVKDPNRRPAKTRLARGLGKRGAEEFYRASLAHLVSLFARAGEGLRPLLLVDPPESRESFPRELGWSHEVDVQCSGDLGDRLRHAFDRAGGAAMAIGSDVPELDLATLREAAGHLAAGRAVLGPCPDGGYYLIGLPEPEPRLFEGIPWSTSEVRGCTLRRAAELGIGMKELAPLDDIDEVEDLLALDARLHGAGPLGACVARLVAALRAKQEGGAPCP